MASKTRRTIASALNSINEDGLSFPSADSNNLEALIEDYFNESNESGSDDDEECGKQFLLHPPSQLSRTTYLGSTEFFDSEMIEPIAEENDGKQMAQLNQSANNAIFIQFKIQMIKNMIFLRPVQWLILCSYQ